LAEKKDIASKQFSKVVDYLFYALYIILIAFTILNMLNIPIPLVHDFVKSNDNLLKFLLIVFASVGIVVLHDKRELTKNVVTPLKHIEKIISAGKLDNSKIVYFKDKVAFYIYFAQELQHLESGAEVLVTSFDKTPNLSYNKGEDKHIEALMETWSKKILAGSITVKQIAHIFTKKDVEEASERISQYSNCFNYSLSAMIGMPIRPYIDIVVIDRNIVLFGFPRDRTAPYDTSFGIAIRDSEIAGEFERYFNIYWNDDCIPLKMKDGTDKSNLKTLDELALNVTNFAEYKDYNSLLMKLIANAAPYKNLNKLIGDLYMFSIVGTYEIPQKLAKKRLEKTYNDMQKMLSEAIPIKASDVQMNMGKTIACAQYKIRATSIEIGDDSYWTSKAGESIFSLNIGGITNKGISVERIFIMDADQQETLSETLVRQRTAGVSVFTIITEMHTRGSFEDFIIIDDNVVIEIIANGNAKMYINKEKINEYEAKFDSYKKHAQKK